MIFLKTLSNKIFSSKHSDYKHCKTYSNNKISVQYIQKKNTYTFWYSKCTHYVWKNCHHSTLKLYFQPY